MEGCRTMWTLTVDVYVEEAEEGEGDVCVCASHKSIIMFRIQLMSNNY